MGESQSEILAEAYSWICQKNAEEASVLPTDVFGSLL